MGKVRMLTALLLAALLPFTAAFSAFAEDQSLDIPDDPAVSLSAEPSPTPEALTVPNPARWLPANAVLEVSEPSEGYVKYMWIVSLEAEARAEAMQAFRGACQERGFALAQEVQNDDGSVGHIYQAGDARFALFHFAASFQLILPVGATLEVIRDEEAEAQWADLFVGLVQPDPTPKPTVAPLTNKYLRGTYNGEAVEFACTEAEIGSKGSYVRFKDRSGQYDIGYLSIDYDRAFRQYQTYHVSAAQPAPGFSIALKTHWDKWLSYDTDFTEFFPILYGDWIEITITELGDAGIGGTLAFSLGGGLFVLENGEFLIARK